ncbi:MULTISPECIES: helix-turn-helix domain-containing protein [Streptomyces]|uniref:helix-turn-helix domain-containing protein n=2 Tax=Streptomyces scabiei TaxID=1930 RepID=UPI0004E6FF17|nr:MULTISPECIES: helix-turn-helix transcriptional regulator [Streptomyces]MBP5869117.1 helix-turn-helix domain-containing protein [Streptomyces sp. LBUM 1485]KFG10409.1 DNA-binding protein [Streptomyces scabiei]MBP5914954.1 helix-turn-helix domain-containing protein [Streptomyces sp. LBUM 1486]MDX2833726.1 helix-turn-helix transcriptional regulator [Streptomyces scabiei]MDX3031413.1 helix-turn-helix transcriptional regulator [Streptomyces scabiei]
MTRRNAEGAGGAGSSALFGEVLRHYREAALLTQDALAREVPCDRSQVAKVEAGTRVPSEQLAKRCDEVLDTGGVLARIWAKVDWYPAVQHPDWFERRVEMEAVAVGLREYQERLIPGLLQTADYARALFSRATAGDEVEERVRARMSRQPRLLSADGPLYVVVLDESCLRTAVGSPEIMREQCEHLLSMGQRPNIRIQVAPADFFGIFRPRQSMSLIELPDERWLYSESMDHSHFSNEPAAYARYSRTYDVLRADIPSARESAALISDVMEGYEQHGQVRAERGDLDQEQPQRRQRRQLHRSGPRYPRPRPRPRQQEP